MNMRLLNELLAKGDYDNALILCVEWYTFTTVFRSTALWYCRYILEKLGQ